MKPTIAKLAGIPIMVVHRVTPCVWEIKPNPKGIVKVGDPPGPPQCFVATERKTRWTKWEGIELPGPPPEQVYFDALKLREEFMGLRTEQEFLHFLDQVGRFSPLAEAERIYGWQLRDFLGCQELLAQFAKRSPETWNQYAEKLMSPKVRFSTRGILAALQSASRHQIDFHWQRTPQIDWRGAKYLSVIQAKDVLSAILATIEIDHLRGAKFGVCVRSDCPNFFEITSRHKRKYCSMYCAHLESVRRTRKRQKVRQ
jgi:hypothetical protein